MLGNEKKAKIVVISREGPNKNNMTVSGYTFLQVRSVHKY